MSAILFTGSIKLLKPTFIRIGPIFPNNADMAVITIFDRCIGGDMVGILVKRGKKTSAQSYIRLIWISHNIWVLLLSTKTNMDLLLFTNNLDKALTINIFS